MSPNIVCHPVSFFLSASNLARTQTHKDAHRPAVSLIEVSGKGVQNQRSCQNSANITDQVRLRTIPPSASFFCLSLPLFCLCVPFFCYELYFCSIFICSLVLSNFYVSLCASLVLLLEKIKYKGFSSIHA